MNTTFIEDYFTESKIKPVSFFYKLPKNVRNGYEKLYETVLNYSDFLWINRNKNMDKYMKNISKQNYKSYHFLLHTEEKGTLLIFIEYYRLLQPIITSIVTEYELYEKYPEYLI